ncbi:N-acetylglucosamine kinase [Paenarthrobacter sp. Z7-10]|uniref:N-acetylglucosamine kinase n=1 Tax=Paenarthrobacter sp. Z7-10 TaxID=2787635 RepID=UPI0022A90FBC|nr:BadF/BadG/BcrA/BcrD ATPase family protein [Paenarthrobacter sp. Z7-10]MCZ2401680.1 N-acetylglucosamine kinase [Paenarthrobacter sp. Z7-10]
MPTFLAVDAGGTSTRAVLVDVSGRCLGYGQAGAGNPVSRGIEGALASLEHAVRAAMGAAGSPAEGCASAVVAMAGASVHSTPGPLAERLRRLGLKGGVVIDADLLAMFFSGTYQPDGYALVAGTGAVAARIEAGRLGAVADGTGWLLGDDGSGYWIGHHVVRAVVAALDGRGPKTALTSALLTALALDPAGVGRHQGRPETVQRLIHELYALRPVELSRFAPLAFAAAEDDVAGLILDRAAAALAGTLAAVTDGAVPGPVVFGGSILTRGVRVAAAVEASLPPVLRSGGAPVLVSDGVVGAAVLVLRHAGTAVDADIFGRISRTLQALRAG